MSLGPHKTLNYNWQVFGADAFSVYTKETDEIDVESACGRLGQAQVARPFAEPTVYSSDAGLVVNTSARSPSAADHGCCR